MLFLLSVYVMLSILLSILVCAAAGLFCACLVSVHVSAPYVIAGSTEELYTCLLDIKLDQYGGVGINSLDHQLSLDNDDESTLFQMSNYCNEESMADIFSTNVNSFNILSLNCQSINAKIDKLKIKLNEMKNRNCVFEAICLQETWAY